jgi:hypothetical protein
MGLEGWSLVACVVFAGLWTGLLSMLTLVMHPMLAKMSGGQFAGFLDAFLPVARKSWFNYAEVVGMLLAPVVALFALGTSAGTVFVLVAVGLGLTVAGPLLVSNRLAEPNYDVILGWNPDAVPSDWLATRHRYFTYNWLRFGTTCVAFAVFLAALVEHLR